MLKIKPFSLDDDESSGTKKYFAFSAPLLATLQKGKMAVIDELDAKLHPNLTAQMIAAFHSKLTNPLNAQLLFNTHDTTLRNDKTMTFSQSRRVAWNRVPYQTDIF